jgi:hypothetical protein
MWPTEHSPLATVQSAPPEVAAPRTPFGAAATIVAGGGLAVIGAALRWFKVTLPSVGVFGRVQVINGLDLRAGKLAMAAGILAIVVGAAMFVMRGRVPGMSLAIAGLVAAAGATGFSLGRALTEKGTAIADRVAQVPPDQQEQVREALRRLFAVGAIRISVQAGLVVALIGGALAAGGSIFALARTAGGGETYPVEPLTAPGGFDVRGESSSMETAPLSEPPSEPPPEPSADPESAS